ACTLQNLGLTADQADGHPRPAGWDGADRLPLPAQVAAFEAEGWDVTDDKRRPLRVLGHFSQPLWLAVRGVAGSLPFQPEDNRPDPWGASLAAEAKRFRKR
ncbi:MAG TPA: hypothetical protein VFW13_05075, partial [Phenylobacterium sp.]|nr:hypothetical protein [Phenylobacterium sp.]